MGKAVRPSAVSATTTRRKGRHRLPPKGKKLCIRLKKPKSAWIEFLSDCRKQLTPEQSRNITSSSRSRNNALFGQFSSQWASTWRNMTDESKKPYFQRYLQSKIEYKEKLKSTPGALEGERKRKRRNRQKRANVPIVNSPYIHFVKQMRPVIAAAAMANNRPLSFKDMGKQLGQAWHQLSRDGKDKYFKLTQQDKLTKAKYMEDLQVSRKTAIL